MLAIENEFPNLSPGPGNLAEQIRHFAIRFYASSGALQPKNVLQITMAKEPNQFCEAQTGDDG
jgi:hypothetical protein